ncbi:MAG: phenylalanine--tRNA ligase subunit beta, partial [bacterium]
DNSKPIAVAGVMGGANSEVSDNTKDIILESAYFNPKSIYHTSKDIKLRTESSMRFERGVDWNMVEYALDRASQLMAELGGGSVQAGKIDEKKQDPKVIEINLRAERVRSLLGISVSDHDINRILTDLGFKVKQNKDQFRVLVPSWRIYDCEREIDLIEEVARIYGYDKIPETLPKGDTTEAFFDANDKTFNKIREILTGYGLNEVLTYSLVNPKDNDNAFAEQVLMLSNPLSEEMSMLRTNIIDSLLSVVSHNKRHQAQEVKIFEIGNIFESATVASIQSPLAITQPPAGRSLSDPDEDFDELSRVGGIVSKGASGKVVVSEEFRVCAMISAKDYDFYMLKGILDQLLLETIGNVGDYKNAKHSMLQPGKAAQVFLGKEPIGYIGQLCSKMRKKYDISDNVVLFDISSKAILNDQREAKCFVPLPKFPAVNRDMAVTVPDKIIYKEVLDAIKKAAGELLYDIELFDRYKGKPLPEGHYSLAFNLRLLDPKKTLSEEDINGAMAKILGALKIMGINLR